MLDTHSHMYKYRYAGKILSELEIDKQLIYLNSMSQQQKLFSLENFSLFAFLQNEREKKLFRIRFAYFLHHLN